MRKKIIAGNWKMNLGVDAAMALLRGVREFVIQTENDKKMKNMPEVIAFPTFVQLAAINVSDQLACGGSCGTGCGSCETGDIMQLIRSAVRLGGQDCFWEKEDGAYTGEISSRMLKEIGCQYVLAGHSERRHVIGESDEIVNKKVKAALAANLKVILCVGEKLEERKEGITEEVVGRQVKKGLEGITKKKIADVTIAYEPVWAIGTGETASAKDAQGVSKFIRDILEKKYSKEAAQKIRILYGGSVKPENISDFIKEKDIDGALVGGASLKLDDFVKIIKKSL